MEMYNFQTASSANHGQNVISVRDPVRGDSVTASQTAFGKAPDLTYAKDGGTNEWKFHSISIDEKLGNGSPSAV